MLGCTVKAPPPCGASGGAFLDDPMRTEGRANTARGAAHFLRETVGRVPTVEVRADSGFYTHGSAAADLLHHHPNTGDTRGGLDAHGWMAAPTKPLSMIVRRVAHVGRRLQHHGFITDGDGDTLDGGRS